uniref:Uncharacterized protein n=1 Tax=Human herpesvirus 2 TaxID=10310 RepID=A0A481TAJ6_HHV2|nr:hypothetical protein [Human alphaherpesvirus 2]QBH78118.1 hypothetical protein [Human alphaherpesvirus 2]QBH78614.1 hypothetical protein [Human alphaherpesvirus 2]QBH79296.1 hypothetical protein [Human alphaherpesvirus 2]QBH83878.1 hypothetical protein [Human alphaherpesvirus 2]
MTRGAWRTVGGARCRPSQHAVHIPAAPAEHTQLWAAIRRPLESPLEPCAQTLPNPGPPVRRDPVAGHSRPPHPTHPTPTRGRSVNGRV